MKNRYEIIEKIKNLSDKIMIKDKFLLETCKILKNMVPHYDWVGFYFLDEDNPENLVLGPYVGQPTTYTDIQVGEGVCGQVAETQKSMVIQDVDKEDNYLSCSINVKSEIVEPIFKEDKFIGELDIDSHAKSPFSKEDTKLLKSICEITGNHL